MIFDAQFGDVDRELAMRITGYADRTFSDLEIASVRQAGRSRFYDLDEVLEIRDERVAAKAEKRALKSAPAFGDDGELIDIEVEKKKKLKAERIGQEIKNAEALGELAPIDLLTSALGDVTQMANSWLEGVPAQIKRVWPETEGTVLDMIERECAKVRNGIADARIEYTDPRLGPYSDNDDAVE